MRVLIAALGVLLIALMAYSVHLLLQSCGVRLPFTDRVLSFCVTAEELATQAGLDTADRQGADLVREVRQRERELALLKCHADPPLPPPPKTPSGLTPDAFDDNDISVMEGCWQLSSDYAVRDINTGAITHFRYWRICFDKNGKGRETMRSTTGTLCRGNLRGRMPGNGTLTMREPGNLQCDNNSSIFRRDITCRINNHGVAVCDTYQPEINGRGSATLRRAR